MRASRKKLACSGTSLFFGGSLHQERSRSFPDNNQCESSANIMRGEATELHALVNYSVGGEFPSHFDWLKPFEDPNRVMCWHMSLN